MLLADGMTRFLAQSNSITFKLLQSSKDRVWMLRQAATMDKSTSGAKLEGREDIRHVSEVRTFRRRHTAVVVYGQQYMH